MSEMLKISGDEGGAVGEGFVFGEEAPGQQSEDGEGEAGPDSEGDAASGRGEGSVPGEIDLLANEGAAEEGTDLKDTEIVEDEGGKKLVSFETFKGRLDEVIGQRDTARKSESGAKERLSEVEKERDTYSTALEGWAGVFGDYEDPLVAAERVVGFVQAAERISARNPSAQVVVDEIFAELERGGGGQSGRTRIATTRRDAKPATKESQVSDQMRSDNVARAEDVIDEIISGNGVAPEFATAIRRTALSKVDGENHLSRKAALDLVKTSVTENGWKLTDVVRREKGRTKRPSAGTGSRNAALTRSKVEREGSKRKKADENAPATPQEGANKRAGIMDGLLRAAMRR